MIPDPLSLLIEIHNKSIELDRTQAMVNRCRNTTLVRRIFRPYLDSRQTELNFQRARIDAAKQYLELSQPK